MAMVKKVEDNKTRAQFWVTIALSISMAFVPWLGLQLVEMGRNQVRQEQYKKDIDLLKQTVEDKQKEIEALKLRQQAPESVSIKPVPKAKPRQQQAKKRQNLNGQNQTYSNGYGLRKVNL
jgi:hypothetical protein